MSPLTAFLLATANNLVKPMTYSRKLIALAALTFSSLLCLPGVSFAANLPSGVDVVVTKTPIDSSLPQFESVTLALAHITQSSNKKPSNQKDDITIIYITSGVYRERVVVKQNNVRFIGEERDSTVIVFNRYAGQAIAEGSTEKWGTRRTATFEIVGSNVTLENLTVKNDFDYPANELKDDSDPTKVSGEQAVALKTDVLSDKVFLNNVALWSYQDTLYLKGDRAYIKGGIVAGHIDFIFGEGTALFDDVTILSRSRYATDNNMEYTGYVTAPSTNIHRPFGLTFFNCRLEREDGVPNFSVALGRPWHPTTTFPDGRYADPYAVGKATFISTYMDSHISKERWTSMGGTAPDGTKRYFNPLTEARFSEFDSSGKGAPASPLQHNALTSENAQFYTPQAILRGWFPPL